LWRRCPAGLRLRGMCWVFAGPGAGGPGGVWGGELVRAGDIPYVAVFLTGRVRTVAARRMVLVVVFAPGAGLGHVLRAYAARPAWWLWAGCGAGHMVAVGGCGWPVVAGAGAGGRGLGGPKMRGSAAGMGRGVMPPGTGPGPGPGPGLPGAWLRGKGLS
jgi:hypothetical protein